MRLDKKTGEWKKTGKELERVNLEEKVAEQEEQINMLSSMLGDILLGGGV